jgi:hypothetical protein
MPPKKQSSHLKKIKESKAQNFKNDLDVNSSDDSETIIGSDEELSSDDELNDEIWYDNTFEDDFNSILPSVFDKMMAASASASSNPKRPSVYMGNAASTVRRKNAAFKVAAANTNPLTSFFPKKDSPGDVVVDDNDDRIVDSLDDLGEVEVIKKFEDALLTLSVLEKDKNIDLGVKTRIQAMCQYFRLRIKNYGAYDASQIIAESIGAKPWRARLIRTWSNQFLKDGALPISRRGKHQKIKSLMHDEDIHGLLVEYLWSKKCDVNVKDFKKHIEEELFPSIGIEEEKKISETTIRVWLRKLGWNHQKLRKGTYMDGHERPDVILAREKFLEKISSFEKFMPTPSEDDITILNEPTLVPGETKHIMVVHDESIFYANDGKTTYWGPNSHAPLRKKGMGLSLHVSDFLTEVEGRLKFEEETACVIMKPGVNRDGWWTSEDLVDQIKNKAIPIFEKCFPDAVGVFAFDNATSHSCFANDALIATRMNLNPGGSDKYTFRDGVMPDGQPQKMHLEDGRQKGIKMILKERNLWPSSDKLIRVCEDCKNHTPTREDCCAVRILSLQQDFASQRPLIQEIIEEHGHKVIFFPKFHCELNFIEYFWGAVKKYTRDNCDYTFKGLEKTVPEALNSVSLEQIRKYARYSWRFIDAYRKGLTGSRALYAVKKYKSHRCILENVAMEE